jgi:nucleoside-diphosphate-sugar epimerase
VTNGLEIKHAVITGPTGAVGTAIIDELVSQGTKVTAVCRSGSKRRSAIPESDLVRVVDCSLDSYSELPGLIGEDADAFFHLAWDGTYGATRQDWALQELNVKYSLDAVEAAAELGCGVFVGAGSQSECGHIDGVLTPTMQCRPDNGYGAAKLAAAEMTRAFCLHKGIRHEWCRIVSLYGPRDGGHTLIMSLINNLLDGKRPQCTPCDQIWDYIYSKDAARAFRLVAERGVDGEVYMIASGSSRPLKEFVLDVRDAVDPAIEIGFGEMPYYPNQVMRLEADVSNLKEHTGFVCEYSFADGIRETAKWAMAARGMSAN